LGGLADLGKVVDALGKFDLKQVTTFLKEIPNLLEVVNNVVDGATDSFGRQDLDSDLN
jgi:hypothetical protein